MRRVKACSGFSLSINSGGYQEWELLGAPRGLLPAAGRAAAPAPAVKGGVCGGTRGCEGKLLCWGEAEIKGYSLVQSASAGFEPGIPPWGSSSSQSTALCVILAAAVVTGLSLVKENQKTKPLVGACSKPSGQLNDPAGSLRAPTEASACGRA